MAKKKLTVPKKHKTSCWDFFEVMHYLEKVHKKDFQDYAGKHRKNAADDVPYQNFWHWICDCNEVRNGCFIFLPDWSYHMISPQTEPWKKEIMQYFYDFLGEDYHERMWAEW